MKKTLLNVLVIIILSLLSSLLFFESSTILSSSMVDITELSNDKMSTYEQTNPLFQIFLSGLGGSLFGALTGGFISSYMNAHYSRRDISEKEHFKDLKEKSIEPLIDELSIYIFYKQQQGSSPLISNHNLESNSTSKSDDILFSDLVNNHYPEVNSKLKSFYELKKTTNHIKNQLENNMRNYLDNRLNFENINHTEVFKKDWINTFIDYQINQNYDDSFIRIWQNYEQRKLYIHHNYDSIKHISDDDKYLIFASNYPDQNKNIDRINEIRKKIIDSIKNCVNEFKELEKDYHKEEQKFKSIREDLLNALLQIKYSTKLVFVKEEKDGIKTKKCTLVG